MKTGNDLKEEMKLTIREIARRMKSAAPILAGSTNEQRNEALKNMREALLSHKEEIFRANREDLERAEKDGVSPQVIKRLRFDEGKMDSVCSGIEQLIALPDPIGRVLLSRELDEGLILKRISCPIGVIGVIFEARPDALVQISSLCVKSGNCAILKGGKETAVTNRALFEVLVPAVEKAGLPVDSLHQAQLHSEIDELLSCDKDVDLIIPRGSNRFVQYIMEHTRIPVMGHADGVCHIFVDSEYDPENAVRIITDAKTQ